jgi:hypothetical protein
MKFTFNPFINNLDAYEQDTPGASDIETLTGDVGGAVHPNAGHNVDVIGGVGILVTGDVANHRMIIATAGSGGMTWTREAGAAVAMAVMHGYINTNAGLTTLTLPAVATVGQVIGIQGEGAGGWIIAQNAGQNIQYGNITTTVGVGGSLASTDLFDSITLMCRVANTSWSLVTAVGTFDII